MTTRALSLYAAANCEAATEKRCRCRCAGKFHGRGLVSEPERILDDGPLEADARQLLEALPEDDPHHIKTRDQLLEAKRRRRGRYVQTRIPEALYRDV